MRRYAWIGALLLTLMAHGRGPGQELTPCEPERPCLIGRPAPAGGWFPYGGGLLHWWNPHCFPRCGTPDDYCRKPPPCVCQPCYPSWYLWGAPPEPVTHPDRCGQPCHP
jgi:hypothetical protein